MKKLLLIVLVFIMFFFKNFASANYNKVFYDLKINSINGELINFNINFPLTTITAVKGKNAHELFKWAKENHGKSTIPRWNFHKILINKEGKVQDTFASMTKPMSKKIIKAIENIL